MTSTVPVSPLSVIGSGALAWRFQDYRYQQRFLLFTGFIHDPLCTDAGAFQSEKKALAEALADRTSMVLVLFSSATVTDPVGKETPYGKHKADLEEMVSNSQRDYLVFRVPQMVGPGDHPGSLVHFLVDAIGQGRPFEIWEHARRHILDVDDVHLVVHSVLEKAEGRPSRVTLDLGRGQGEPAAEIVSVISSFLGKPHHGVLVNKGSSPVLSPFDPFPLTRSKEVIPGYLPLERSLEKYFGHLKGARPLLSIVVPTYNEEKGIGEFYRRTKAVLESLSPRFDHEILFVNDHSRDRTLDRLRELSSQDEKVRIIHFSRNFGNQVAITAGMDHARGDLAVIIDDDLQDPPEQILNLLAFWERGYKVVFGVRPNRKGVNPLFKAIALLYYRVIAYLSEIEIHKDTGDFRLVDRVVMDSLREMREENRYYRGMVSWVGFPQFGWVYERDKRYAGRSTFSLKKYVNFAFNGLTSFTDKPLFFASMLGFVITMVGFVFLGVLVVSKILDPSVSIRGWTSLMALIVFFGGIQLISIGIVGIYISKIYREVKRRPLYVIEEIRGFQSKKT